MFAQTIIVGRLGRDPEMRYTPDGTAVVNFNVATDRVWYDADGKKEQRTTWYRVTAWKRLAETCNQYLSKGRLVMVVGELQEPKPYQGRDGVWHASLDLRADSVKFLESKDIKQRDGEAEESAKKPEAKKDIFDLNLADGSVEEIPF